jgi:uncharacterized protein
MRLKFLNQLSYWITEKTWQTGIVLLFITLLMGWMSSQLTLSMSMTNLLPSDDPKVEAFDTIIEEFDGASTLIVVAEGEEVNIKAFMDALVTALDVPELDEYIKTIDYKVPQDFIREHGLMLVKSKNLENQVGIFESNNLSSLTTALNDNFEKEYTQSDEKLSSKEQETQATQFIDGLNTWVEGLASGLSNDNLLWAEDANDALTLGDPYYMSWSKRMGIMQIIPTFTMFDIEPSIFTVNTVEDIVEKLAPQYHVEAGITGSVALGRDEMEAMEGDSMIITSLALLGILILFILAFRMVTAPFLAILSLIIGVIWAMGIAWLLVGELNMMTSMMAVVLIGLGIDFSIHIISLFTERRRAGDTITESVRQTLAQTGPGILTGGLTTSLAFFTIIISKTAGMREFGIVLGVGIIMTMLTSMTVMPLLLVFVEKFMKKFRKEGKVRKVVDLRYLWLGSVAKKAAQYRVFTLAGSAIFLIFLAYKATNLKFDYNYLNMEPVGLTSIILQDKLIEEFDMSTDFAMLTVKTMEEAELYSKKAKEMETASMVQSISDYLPSEDEQIKRQHYIEEIQTHLVTLKLASIDKATFLDELYRLEANIIEMQDMAFTGGQDKLFLKTAFLVGVKDVPETDMAPEEIKLIHKLKLLKGDEIFSGSLTSFIQTVENANDDNLSDLSNEYSQLFMARAKSMANPEKLTIASLPTSIKNQMVGKSGEDFLITIFPRENVWDTNYIKRFSAEMESVNPSITGMPLVFNRLIPLIAEDGKNATYLAIVVIFLLLLLDFRRLSDALLAMLPLIAGVIMMLGIMEMTGLMLTMLNIMAVPMIIGISIDDGVHILHRYRGDGNSDLYGTFASTGRAVLLTTLTTMIGFGSLWFATYRGLGSMGIALFIGIGASFVATVVLLSALLKAKKSQ